MNSLTKPTTIEEVHFSAPLPHQTKEGYIESLAKHVYRNTEDPVARILAERVIDYFAEDI